jgi:hypothetical protein
VIPANPYIELLVGSVIIIFWFPLIAFAAYRVMRWMLEMFDPL